MLRLEKITILGCLLAGLLMLVWGGWLPIKAQLAQYLLNRAWQLGCADGEPVKPWPWADTWPVGRLLQPELGIDEIVLMGDSGEVLAFGPGLLPQSDKPGGAGHTILAGHRDTSFRFLQRLQKGDLLIMEGQGTTTRYRVAAMSVVQAGELYLDPAESGLLTLITCYPFNAVNTGTRQRYVVQAERVNESGVIGKRSAFVQ